MSYIGQGLPADVFAGFTVDKFTGTGVASQTLTLTKAPLGETALLVTIDGVVQEPTDDFTVSGTTVTIVGTAPLNSEINVTHLSGTVPNTLASAVDVNGLSDGVILDADGDTTISADTDDEINIKVGGTDAFNILGSKLIIADNASHTDDFLQIESPSSGGGYGIQIRRNDSNTDQNVGRVQFGNNTDVDLGIVSCKTDGATNTGAIVVSTASSGTTAERFRVTEAGIHIGGTGDANALDDYEEGTHTASITDSSGDVTSITLNSSFNQLSYTKIGRQVFVGGTLVISSFSGSWGSGQCRITLPFAVGDLTDRGGGVTGSIGTYSVDYTTGTAPYLVCSEGTSYATFQVSGDNITGGNGQPSNSAQLYIGLTYMTA